MRACSRRRGGVLGTAEAAASTRTGTENLSETQGLLIWVRVRSPEKESQAQEILLRRGGKAVHVHEMELAKRVEDLPLHSLRPDPWLGDERLGQP